MHMRLGRLGYLSPVSTGAPPGDVYQTVVTATTPIAYWSFNGNLNDSIAGRNGTPQGSQSYVGGLPTNSNAGLNCAGLAWAAVAHNAALKPAVGSLMAWFKPASLHNGVVISSDAVGENAGDFRLTALSNGRIRSRFQTATGANIDTALNYYEPNQIICAVVTFSTARVALFLDGNIIGENTEWLGGLTGNVQPWYFGNAIDSPGIFNGVIDEFAIWNRVLTRNEIFTLAQTEPDE